MGLYKDVYLDVLEELIEVYLETHPNATWDDAYELLQDKAYDVAMDQLADIVEHSRMVES